MKLVALASALAVALLAAGCGGGGGGGKSLSKEQYAAQLSKICSDANAQRKQVGSVNGIADVAQKGPKLKAALDQLIAKAEKLKPPKEIKADADKIIAESKQLSALLGQVIDAAKKNDLAKIAQLGAQGQALTKDLDALGTKVGAPACAQG
jgi:hypothetical protein